MAEVSLNISGRNYGIACDDGQEEHVTRLGQYVDERLREISRVGGATNESHLLVLTALVLADEVHELQQKSGNDNRTQKAASQKTVAPKPQEDDLISSDVVDAIAARVEQITKRLERA